MAGQVQIERLSTQETVPVAGLKPTPLPRQDLRSLYANLLKLTETQSVRDEFLMQLLQQAVSMSNAPGGAYFMRQSNGTLVLGPRLMARELLSRSPGIRKELATLATEVAETGRVQVQRDIQDDRLISIAVPVSVENDSNEVITLTVETAMNQVEPMVALLQLVAGYVNFWGARAAAMAHRREADISAAMLELVSRLHQENDSAAMYFTLVNELRAFTGCERVAIGIRRSVDGKCRVKAVSGLSRIDERTQTVSAIEAVFSDTVVTPGVSTIPSRVTDLGSTDSGESARFPALRLRCHESLARDVGASHVASTGLRNASDESIGAIVLWWNPDDALTGEQQESHRRFIENTLEAMAVPLGTCLQRLRKSRAGTPVQGSRRVKRFTITAIAAALVASLFLPLQHQVKATTIIEPVDSRNVAVPFDSIISEALVEPGQRVASGDILLRLDGRELEWQHDGLRAEKSRAAKRRDISMADGDTSSAQIARLEMARVENQLKLLKWRIANLELRSPIAGIVVDGDLERNTGSPVRRGQTLFEIAPLDTMTAEVAIPARDLAHVGTDSAASFSLEAYPGERWNITVGELQPRSEVRDGENVFLATIQVGNEDRRLRPGMRGVASVQAGERSLGWIVFHRALEHAAVWLNLGALETEDGRFGFAPSFHAIWDSVRSSFLGLGVDNQ